jgi:hypothetical protein
MRRCITLMTRLWLTVWLVVVPSSGTTLPAESDREGRADTPEAVPVVVELFTSEGCSSCPQADGVLTRLLSEQPVAGVHVIGLSEYVDYWDRLGRGMLLAITAASRQPRVTVRLSASSVPGAGIGVNVQTALTVDSSSSGTADVIVGVTEDGLMSDVRRGENRGRHLRHSAVVRLMRTMGSVSPGGEPFARTVLLPRDPLWKSDVRVFAFVQSRAGRRILGAAETAATPQAPAE